MRVMVRLDAPKEVVEMLFTMWLGDLPVEISDPHSFFAKSPAHASITYVREL